MSRLIHLLVTNHWALGTCTERSRSIGHWALGTCTERRRSIGHWLLYCSPSSPPASPAPSSPSSPTFPQPMDQSEQLSITDPSFAQQVQRLHKLTIYGRWLFVACLWLTIAPVSLWGLRAEISLWQQYFTWVAVRYGLFYHPLSTFGLAFCIGMTAAVLVWQSRNILLGLPPQEKQRLEKQVYRIRQQGPTHPLWKWVCH